MSRKIFITKADMKKLKSIVENEKDFSREKQYMHDLKTELDKANVVSSDKLPADVITMNSKVLLSIDGEEEEYHLVYPDEADVLENKISVLSPIGTAILGYKEGNQIEWQVPSGIAKVQIKKVIYQP